MSITALRIVTPANEFPTTLSEMKSHLRITHDAEDSVIQGFIMSATQWAQDYTRRVFIDTQVELRIDRFPETGDSPELRSDPQGQWYYVPKTSGRKKSACVRDKAIWLPGGMVTAVNDIDYIDDQGAPQTLTGATSTVPGTDYQEDLTDDERALLYPGVTDGWPAVQAETVNAVTIDYQVGWADSSALPQNIAMAVRFKAADLFAIRDTIDAGSKSALLQIAENFLDPYVVPSF